MACPKCGCKEVYGYNDDDEDICSADFENLNRCAACGEIFHLEDELDEDDDSEVEPEYQSDVQAAAGGLTQTPL